MLENLKNTLIIGFILLVFAGLFSFYIKSCRPEPIVDGPALVTAAKTVTPTAEDKKVVPSDHKIITVIKPNKTPVIDGWEIKDKKIIVHVDSKCATCAAEYTQVDSTKTYVGFSFRPKFFLGYSDNTLIPGYDQEIFRFGRTSVDLLASVPYVAIAMDYNITKGFFIGAGGYFKYANYKEITDVGSYSINLDFWKTVYPGAQMGFHF